MGRISNQYFLFVTVQQSNELCLHLKEGIQLLNLQIYFDVHLICFNVNMNKKFRNFWPLKTMIWCYEVKKDQISIRSPIFFLMFVFHVFHAWCNFTYLTSKIKHLMLHFRLEWNNEIWYCWLCNLYNMIMPIKTTHLIFLFHDTNTHQSLGYVW